MIRYKVNIDDYSEYSIFNISRLDNAKQVELVLFIVEHNLRSAGNKLSSGIVYAKDIINHLRNGNLSVSFHDEYVNKLDAIKIDSEFWRPVLLLMHGIRMSNNAHLSKAVYECLRRGDKKYYEDVIRIFFMEDKEWWDLDKVHHEMVAQFKFPEDFYVFLDYLTDFYPENNIRQFLKKNDDSFNQTLIKQVFLRKP